MLKPMCEPDPLQQLSGVRHDGGVAFAERESGQQRIFQHRVLRQKMMLLKHEADGLIAEFGKLRLGKMQRIDLLERDRAGRGPVQRSEQMQKRAFAGAGRPDDRERLAGGNLERKVAQNLDAAAAAFEILGDLGGFEVDEVGLLQDHARCDMCGLAARFFGRVNKAASILRFASRSKKRFAAIRARPIANDRGCDRLSVDEKGIRAFLFFDFGRSAKGTFFEFENIHLSALHFSVIKKIDYYSTSCDGASSICVIIKSGIGMALKPCSESQMQHAALTWPYATGRSSVLISNLYVSDFVPLRTTSR